MRKRIRKNSLYRRYFLSYSCIAMIPVIAVVGVLIIIMDNNHTQTARDLYRRANVQTAAHIDSILRDMETSVSNFNTDAYLSQLLDAEGGDAQLTAAIAGYLKRVEDNSRLPMKAIYYSVGETDVYTASGVIGYKTFEQSVSREANLTLSGFFTQLNTILSMHVWLLEPGVYSGSLYRSAIAFAFPVFKSDANKRGTFVFLVSMADVLDIAAEYLGMQPDYLYLYAANYALIGTFETTLQNDDERNQILRHSANTIGEIKIADRRYQIMRYKTDLYGFNIITCVQLDTLYGDARALRLHMALVALAAVLIIGVLALQLARYSYRPVKALLENIGDDEDEEEPEDEPEAFERINQHLTAMNSQVLTLKERLSVQRPMVRDRVMLSLLRGTLDDSRQEQFNIVFPDVHLENSACYVALLRAEGRALEYHQPELEELDIDGADAHGVYMEDERLFAMLIVVSDEADNRRAQCAELLRIMESLKIDSAKIGAGKLVRGAEHIPTSYLEAYIALNEKMNAQNGTAVFLYNDITVADNTPRTWLLPEDGTTSIYLQSLCSVDTKTALRMLDTLHQRLEENFNSILNMTYTRFELFSKALAACEPEVARRFGKTTVSIESFPDENRFWELIRDLTVANCEAVENRLNDTQREVRRKILTTMREHCCEPDFSLGYLSEIVGFSSTYINRSLREETGYGFMKLSSILRIARAKEELLKTDHMIKDIVANVGYMDIASFTRKFKEMEGVTPGEYRRLNGK